MKANPKRFFNYWASPKEELQRIVSGIKAPVSANMIEGGKTRLLTLEELKDMGLASVGYPLTAIFSAARALEDVYAHLIGQGNSIAIADKLTGIMQRFDTRSAQGADFA